MNSLSQSLSRKVKSVTILVGVASLLTLFVVSLHGQKPDMQQQMADLKASMAKNKQALAQYTWNEQVTISLKGEVKKVQHYQVQIGPDGKPQKTSLDPPPAPPEQSSGRGGRLKEHVVAKKTDEYQEYAESMKTLAQQYVPPNKDALQTAYAKGNVSFSPSAGNPGEINIVITNYIKPNDSMTIGFNKEQKQISSITIASYMDSPSDVMNLTVQFSSLPDGTSHVAGMNIDGVSKQLSIATQNSNYQKL